ncbi:MAG: FtsX-like permease family protein [Ekhidna sp.]
MIKRFADWLFKWFCRKDLYLFIRGDLQEYYEKQRSKHSQKVADLLYMKEVILLLRLNLIGLNLFQLSSINSLDMFRNYIKIALRNLKRNQAYAIINIAGLATGIVSLFFILIFIEKELNYDKHHENVDRLYRISTETTINGKFVEMATSPPGLSRRLISDLPDIEASTRIVGFLGIQKNILKVDDRTFLEKKGYLADPNFFDILTYPIITGDKKTMLEKPQSIVLSHTLAKKIFNSTEVLGRVINIINDYGSFNYLVTGVYENEGISSHLNPSFICSMNSGSIGEFVYNNDRVSGNNFLFTYIKTKEGTDITALKHKVPTFLAKYVEDAKHTHGFIPVSDIYLYSHSQNEAGLGGDIKYIYILITIAILILAVACVNFANMATAQASQRTKEIGMRKTFGAQRKMIIAQFLGESTIITLLATFISLICIFILSPYYTNLTGKEVPIALILSKTPWLLSIAIITSLLAGSYPSFYLSTMKLQSILGSKSTGNSGSFLIRKVLVVFQFAVGILLIVGSLTTFNQLRYIQSKQLGFQSTNQVVVPLQAEEAINQLENVKLAFSSLPGVQSVAGTSYTPAEVVLSDNRYRATLSEVGEGVIIRQNDIDFKLIETLGIEVLAGRTFDRNFAENDSSVVLNEAAVKALGLKTHEVVDQLIYTSEGDGVIGYRVIGVVADFHANSLHRPIEPYLFAMRPGRGVSSLIVTIDKDDYRPILSSLEKSWNEMFPTLPFEFDFLDQQLNARYVTDIKFGQVIVLFTVVALILCLIGIFALTSFTVQQSLKSISIRKVLGASAQNIYSVMLSRFLLLILVASAISIPIGMFLMNKWLELFAYRIQPGLFSILLPIGTILICTLLVVSDKLLKVARVNPAKILRSE